MTAPPGSRPRLHDERSRATPPAPDQAFNNSFKSDGTARLQSTIAGGGGVVKVLTDYLQSKSKQDIEFATSPFILQDDWRKARGIRVWQRNKEPGRVLSVPLSPAHVHSPPLRGGPSVACLSRCRHSSP